MGSDESQNGVELNATPRSSEDSVKNETAPALPSSNSTNAIPAQPSKPTLHPSVYVIVWITLSSSVILFNKWILHTLKFEYPIFLTTWHLIFATIATQILARTTHLLDGVKNVRMTGRVYLRAIVPIGALFSLSLICGNRAYLTLSVAFIQMLKATTPVAVLLAGYGFGVEKPNFKILFNVSFIVIGVIIASYGELEFVLEGFLYQLGGVVFEAMRLVMIQQLLSGDKYKMDPLVSLYYFAPVCAAMNLVMAIIFESGKIGMEDVMRVGIFTFFINALIAFLLNVSVVFLIGKTSSLVMTLCGVLKDIMLVVASIIIWGTHISFLQIFGYGIAIGGLLYYKLGGDKLKDSYHQLKTQGGYMWQDYGEKHPGRRKAIVVGAAALAVFLTFGLLRPGPSVSVIDGYDSTLPGSGSTLIVPNRKLDIVIASYDEPNDIVKKNLDILRELKIIKDRSPYISIYSKKVSASESEIKSATMADNVKILANKGLDPDTYLKHITQNWDDLAAHTLFLNADFHLMDQVAKRIENFFNEKTGMLPLGDLSSCKSENCVDVDDKDATYTRVPQIYASVYEEMPPEDILLTYGSGFIASAKRIRATSKHVYQHLLSVIDSDEKHFIHKDKHHDKYKDTAANPFFSRAVERSWAIILKCSEKRLENECKELKMERTAGMIDNTCQCLD